MNGDKTSPRIVFGGAFDPVHTGHLALAEFVSAELDGARVLFVPAALSPFKQGHSETFATRVNLLQTALHDTPFEIDPREGSRSGPSFMIDTLRELQKEETSDLHLLIGEDNLADFVRWKDWDKILDIAQLLVVNRPGSKNLTQRKDVPHHSLTWPAMALSSTWLRERLRAKRPCRYLLPPGVWEMILRDGLYGINDRTASQ